MYLRTDDGENAVVAIAGHRGGELIIFDSKGGEAFAIRGHKIESHALAKFVDERFQALVTDAARPPEPSHSRTTEERPGVLFGEEAEETSGEAPSLTLLTLIDDRVRSAVDSVIEAQLPDVGSRLSADAAPVLEQPITLPVTQGKMFGVAPVVEVKVLHLRVYDDVMTRPRWEAALTIRNTRSYRFNRIVLQIGLPELGTAGAQWEVVGLAPGETAWAVVSGAPPDPSGVGELHPKTEEIESYLMNVGIRVVQIEADN